MPFAHRTPIEVANPIDEDRAARGTQTAPRFLEVVAAKGTALGADHPLSQRLRSEHVRLLLDRGPASTGRNAARTALAGSATKLGCDNARTENCARGLSDALDSPGDAVQAFAICARYGVVPPEPSLEPA